MTAKLPPGPTKLHKNLAVGMPLKAATDKALGKSSAPASPPKKR